MIISMLIMHLEIGRSVMDTANAERLPRSKLNQNITEHNVGKLH